jgi:hypothetical protein
MLSVIYKPYMLSVVMLNVIMLNVVAPIKINKINFQTIFGFEVFRESSYDFLTNKLH